MMKKLIALLAVIVCFSSTAALAASTPEVIWAGGALRLSDESAPAYMADTFISLGQIDTMNIFTNPMFFVKDSEIGVDVGVGARIAVLGGRGIAGYNVFVDYTSDHSFKRLSTGAEFFHQLFSAHLNLYLPFSDDHGGREALAGLDLTCGIPVPNASFVTIWPGVYYYNGMDRSDMKGASLAVEVKPMRVLSLYFGGRNDALESGRNDRGELFAKAEVTIPMQRLGKDLFRFDRGEYPLNVNNQMANRVVREPFITYEHKP